MHQIKNNVEYYKTIAFDNDYLFFVNVWQLLNVSLCSIEPMFKSLGQKVTYMDLNKLLLVN